MASSESEVMMFIRHYPLKWYAFIAVVVSMPSDSAMVVNGMPSFLNCFTFIDVF